MMQASSTTQAGVATRARALWLTGLAVAYYISALLGRQFVVMPEGIAVLWPASGVLVAALLLSPPHLRSATLVVGALANVAANVSTGASLALSLGFAVTNMFEGWFVWRLLRLSDEIQGDAESTRRVLVWSGLVFVGTAVSALAGAALTSLTFGAPYWSTWRSWWLASGFGTLVVAPFVIALSELRSRAWVFGPKRILEATVLGAGLITISHLVFSAHDISTELLALRTYILFPLFIWAVVRFDLPGGMIAVLLASAAAMWYTSQGSGPFVTPETLAVHSILGAQAFCGISVVSVLALGTILSERRRAELALRHSEEQLRDSEEQLRQALDAVAIGTWNWDLLGGQITWNEHHALLFGMRLEEFDGTYEMFARPIHPDDLPGLNAAVTRAHETQTFYHHEFRIVRPDGTIRWIAGRGRVVAQKEGRPARMAGTVMDITATREAEEREQRLAEERNRILERLQLVLQQMPIACVINDTNFHITYWNPAAERIFGYTSAEISGHTPQSFLVPPSSTTHVAELQQHVRTGNQVTGIAQTLTKSGRVIICEWQHTPLTDVGGAFIGSLSMAQDVSARIAAEEEIRRLNVDLERRVAERTSALEAANHELEAFSYSVSHDLRAPLRHIDGFVNLLVRREAERLDATSSRYLRVIGDSSKRMGNLIDDLLMLSRVGRAEVQLQAVAVGDLVRQSLEELAPATDGRHITWEVGPLPIVQGDPRLLRQVVGNLLSNAIKYTGRAPEAHICLGTLDGAEGEAIFFVRDNGVGFDQQYAHKLFGVFQRLHRDDEFEGTGIGLATVRRIVHGHGGRVWAEGQVGEGATFFVALPAA